MKLEAVVAVAQPADEAAARAQAFLQSRGYRRGTADFVRGSLWGTLSALDPRKWKARVSIRILKADHCGLVFDVNTAGHPFLLPSERRFWDGELEALSSVLRGETPTPELDIADAATRAAGWRAVWFALGCATSMAIGCGVVQIMLARQRIAPPPGLVGVGAGVGVAVGLALAARTAADRR